MNERMSPEYTQAILRMSSGREKVALTGEMCAAVLQSIGRRSVIINNQMARIRELEKEIFLLKLWTGTAEEEE